VRCTYCGSTKHTAVLCPKTAGGQSARLHLRCSYCGARDHDLEACPRTAGGRERRVWCVVDDHFIKDR